MIYSIPIVGWLLGLFFAIGAAVPFWFCWNALAPKFFYWLPLVYQQLSFWETVGLFVIISILKSCLPALVSVNNSSESKNDK